MTIWCRHEHLLTRRERAALPVVTIFDAFCDAASYSAQDACVIMFLTAIGPNTTAPCLKTCCRYFLVCRLGRARAALSLPPLFFTEMPMVSFFRLPRALFYLYFGRSLMVARGRHIIIYGLLHSLRCWLLSRGIAWGRAAPRTALYWYFQHATGPKSQPHCDMWWGIESCLHGWITAPWHLTTVQPTSCRHKAYRYSAYHWGMMIDATCDRGLIPHCRRNGRC